MLLTVISTVVPLIAVIISYILGITTQIDKRTVDVLRVRYETLYIPFMRDLIVAPAEWIVPHEHSLTVRVKLYDLIMQNAEFLGSKSGLLLPKYNQAFLNMLEFEDGNVTYKKAPSDYDAVVIELEDALLIEAQSISRKLRYPDLSGTISTIRAQSTNKWRPGTNR